MERIESNLRTIATPEALLLAEIYKQARTFKCSYCLGYGHSDSECPTDMHMNNIVRCLALGDIQEKVIQQIKQQDLQYRNQVARQQAQEELERQHLMQ